MTFLTRTLPALAGATVAAVVVGGLTTAPAIANPPINSVKQHTRVSTKTTAGQRRDTSIYPLWARDRKALPTIAISGYNSTATVSTWETNSPVPGLSQSGAKGYCVKQTYRLSTMSPTATATWATTVMVYRHGKVVAQHTSSGAFDGTVSTDGAQGPVVKQKIKVRLPHFRFSPGDRVVWFYDGKLNDAVNRFQTQATIAPSCGK